MPHAKRHLARHLPVAALLLALLPAIAAASDWPMWRYDAGRTGCSPATLPNALHKQWSIALPAQSPAWVDEGGMQFDRVHHPIVVGQRIITTSSTDDTVTAYDLATGKQVWRRFTNGPVRTPAAGWRDRVFVGSDDGRLYCLDAATGQEHWRVRGGPRRRLMIGNERVIDTWPVRGGPVVADGVVYFAAGVWPFMGTFVHAVDAATGKTVWTNDSMSFTFRERPHPGAASFAGLSPQGFLAVDGDRLIVPGSRSNAAVLDRRTGRFLFYAAGGGTTIMAARGIAFSGGSLSDLERGLSIRMSDMRRVYRAVLGPDTWYTEVGAFDAANVTLKRAESENPYTHQMVAYMQGEAKLLWKRRRMRPLLAAGDKLVCSARKGLEILDVSKREAPPQVAATVSVDGRLADVIAAHGRLLVLTDDNVLHCYGETEAADPAQPVAADNQSAPTDPAAPAWRDRAGDIVRTTDQREGYCFVWGLRDGGLVLELLRQTEMHVVAVDADAEKIAALRAKLHAADLYGRRASAIVADPANTDFAPYMASLITSEQADAKWFAEGSAFPARLAGTLRPYGGAAWLSVTLEHLNTLAKNKALEQTGVDGVNVGYHTDHLTITREGPLPGSAGWFGQNADPGNTRCSRDQLVRAPLGVLWYGNSMSNKLILPRHGEGPVQQIAGGRLFIEGANSLSASDVYTGRLLWSRDFPELGKFYDVTKHQRGAHALGSNFYAVPDAVYVAHKQDCHVLDPATGKTRRTLQLPQLKGDDERSNWMFMIVDGDLLIAGVHPVVIGEKNRYNKDAVSKALAVMNRHTGKVLWTRRAEASFPHYGIAAGNGKVFCIDKGKRLLALDARTGDTIWQREDHVGDKLSYSAEYDILLSRAALRGKDGAVLWSNLRTHNYPKHENPHLDSSADPLWWGKWGLMMRGDTVLTQSQRAFNLLTGEQWTVQLGDEATEWRYRKAHGCGPLAASEHLLTFRSGCAGFYDLENDGGTGNLGGFRSGCQANLLAADGVLTAPDYTRTCTCGYQNRSSLGLIHMPEVEYWTFGAPAAPGRVGINFGAPGDRRAPDGTLWRESPDAVGDRFGGGDPAPFQPQDARRFYHHSSRIEGDGHWRWIAGSGLIGVRQVHIPVAGLDLSEPVTMRLVFAEIEDKQPGQRVFSVSLGEQTLIDQLDIRKAAGAANRAIVHEVRDVSLGDHVKDRFVPISFKALKGEPLICGVEIVDAKRRRPAPTISFDARCHVATGTLPVTWKLPGAATAPGDAPMQVAWRKLSGEGTVMFEDSTATFSAYGPYVLSLTATAGGRATSEELLIYVDPPRDKESP